MKIYYQLLNKDDNQITSVEADIECKLFATAVKEKGEAEVDMNSFRTQANTKAKEIQTNSELNRSFELKSEYDTQAGHKGLFYVVPDII